METVILAYYLGLMVFMFNGFIYLGMRNERLEAKAREERLRRLLMRAKLRGSK